MDILITILKGILVVCGVLVFHTIAEDITAEENSYCKVQCPGVEEQHVMCRFPTKDVSVNCTSFEPGRELTENDKVNIVKLHNAYRLLASEGRVPGFPPAFNMKLLRYDFELETIARHWVVQCRSEVPKCIDSRDGTHNTLVRYVTSPLKGFNPRGYLDDIEKWYSGYQSFPLERLGKFDQNTTKGLGNLFARIMYANTERIGCARSGFLMKWPQETELRESALYVCLYGPGLTDGQAVYMFPAELRSGQDSTTNLLMDTAYIAFRLASMTLVYLLAS